MFLRIIHKKPIVLNKPKVIMPRIIEHSIYFIVCYYSKKVVAYLVYTVPYTRKHGKWNSIINIVCCSLSLLCLCMRVVCQYIVLTLPAQQGIGLPHELALPKFHEY